MLLPLLLASAGVLLLLLLLLRVLLEAGRISRESSSVTISPSTMRAPGCPADCALHDQDELLDSRDDDSELAQDEFRVLEKRQHHPFEMMHAHDFKLEEAELAIKTLAREIEGQESIHSCLSPEF